MKRVIFIFLAASLTANAWLLWREPARAIAEAERPVMPAPPVDPARGQAAAAARAMAAVEGLGLAEARAALQAAGADEFTVQASLEGRLRRAHAEKMSAEQIARWRTTWWRHAKSAGPSWLRDGVSGSLRELLGPDPLDVADAELRYDFLPPEKRRLMAMIDLDYHDMQRRVPATNAVLKPESDEYELLNRERLRDVQAALTAEEKAEYELRFGGTASSTVRRFAMMNVTEQEFRAIKPVIDELGEQSKALPRGAAFADAFGLLQQQTLDALVERVGFERTVAYAWAVESGPYQATAAALTAAGRPANDAAKLLQLAAETGEAAAAIHRDSTLQPDQRRAALANLQTAIQLRVDALVPPEAKAAMPADALQWVTDLGQGKYRRFQPTLMSSGWIVPTLRDVAARLPAKDQTPFLPRLAQGG